MKKRSILLVDNDHISNYISVQLINSLEVPHQFSIAENAEDALAYLTNNADQLPDYIFLELQLPSMNGFDFLEKFLPMSEDFNKDIKIIILSNMIYPDLPEKLNNYSIHSCIQKPLTKQALRESVREVSV